MAEKTLLLDYGSGGRASHRLIGDLFLKHFHNPVLASLNDAALLDIQGPVAMSTDTYTVDPLFFPGGDIGSLAVHGTVNDVAMLGAIPRYLSCGFILEEGLDMALLERIVVSMARGDLAQAGRDRGHRRHQGGSKGCGGQGVHQHHGHRRSYRQSAPLGQPGNPRRRRTAEWNHGRPRAHGARFPPGTGIRHPGPKRFRAAQ